MSDSIEAFSCGHRCRCALVYFGQNLKWLHHPCSRAPEAWRVYVRTHSRAYAEHMQSFADRHLHVVAVNWHQRAVSKICGLSCTLILFVCLLCSDVKTEYETIKVVPCFSGCLSPLVLYPVSLPHGEPTFQPVSICSVPVVVRYYTQTSSVMAPALLLLQSTCPLPLACGVSCNVSRYNYYVDISVLSLKFQILHSAYILLS